MRFPLYIAKRYLFSKSSNNAINIITLIAAFGIIVGATALFIVLSGFEGLKDYSLDFTSFTDPDLKIITAKGKSFELTQQDIYKINSLEGVTSYSKTIEERFVLNHDEKNLIVSIKGVDKNYPENTITNILSEGSEWMAPNTDQIVSGLGVYYDLSLSIFNFNNPLTIFSIKPGKGQITSTRSAFTSVSAVNVGSFEINEELDNSLVYANLETLQYLLNYNENQISAIEFVIPNPENIASVREKLQAIFRDRVLIKNRIQLNDALYKMLNTENLAVYLIFTLILIIALFNVVGSIVMMILDKKKNLQTLFNIGVTIRQIRNIFFFQGSLMTLIGGGFGLLLGYIIVVLQKQFSLVMLTDLLPYPVVVKPINFIIVFVTISILGVAASKIASTRISKRLIS